MKQTVFFKKKPVIISSYTVAGPKESKGPLGEYFDMKLRDDKQSQKTFEKSESMMQIDAINGALNKCGKKFDDIGAIISGDLVNEITASSFCAREFPIPYLGVYDACSTFGESLIVASSLISGSFLENAVCISSSHFSSIERQFRFPLELGTAPTPTSQWTVTGAGCSVLSGSGEGLKIESATIGKVIDLGIKDANNMGGAMAPAAVDTIIQHLKDTGRDLNYYDYIFTGDLGRFGETMFKDLMEKEGFKVGDNYNDCGGIIFDDNKAVQGGSGAGCVSTVFNSFIVKKLMTKKGSKLLLMPTGALLSKVSSLQGETIPCICHAVSIVNEV
jgi:stage V sporulation protein AD